MKKLIAAAILAITISPAFAQKFMTRTGKVSFYSSTPLENIEAFNNETAAAVNMGTGDVVFQVPIKSFKFQKATMQDHFNEEYMESDKFPKGTFKGKIENPKAVDLSKNGTYNVTVSGSLTLHGVTHNITTPGTITVKDGNITTYTKFKVKIADYNIKVPSLMTGKIANVIEVTVNSVLKPA